MNFVYVVLSLVVFWCAVSKFVYDAVTKGVIAGAQLTNAAKPMTATDKRLTVEVFVKEVFWMSAHLATDLLVMLMSAVAAVFFLMRG